VSWVYVSLHVFGMMPAPLAAVFTLLFCAYLALFPALVGNLQARLELPPAIKLLVFVPAAWILTEWMRGWLLTGFPWLASGYSQTGTPLAGFAPAAGVYGVGWALLLSSAALALAVAERRAVVRAVALAVAALPYLAGLALQQLEWSTASGKPISVALVQGNIEQALKFEPKRYAATLATYRRLIDSTQAKLVVLPETAIPRFLDSVDPAYLDGLAGQASARGSDILVGVPFRDATGRYYNGVVNLGATELQFYAKAHLVPLGEFVPPEFGWIVSILRIPLSDFSRGGVQRPMRAAGEHVALTVCYEDAFGEELVAQLPQATLLANVSNVAWFGDSLAPEQHLQISRMRAIETGRYMVRATNTGVTAIIDHEGRVVSQLPQFTEAVLEGHAEPRTGTTPYMKWVNRPVIAGGVLAVVACVLIAIRPRRRILPL
jgi:apolipoprotein N-acyltransferase